MRFARAQTATLAEAFDHVAVIAPPAYLDSRRGGNFVVAASDRPFDRARIEALIAARQGEERALVGSVASRFAHGGSILTDDYAPVDQWLSGRAGGPERSPWSRPGDPPLAGLGGNAWWGGRP